MKIDSSKVFDSIRKYGGILSSIGSNEGNDYFKNLIKKTVVTASLLTTISASASVLPNEQGNVTINPIQEKTELVNSSAIENNFNQNYLILKNLEEGNYDSTGFEEYSKSHMSEDIIKDKRNIRTILNEVQQKNNINKNVLHIEEFGIDIEKDEPAESIQNKLLEVSNTHESSDVRVRSKVMAFIITNEGLSNNVGRDAQNHLTVGYGYDVDEQINSRVTNKISREFAKKHVYKELAAAGLNVDELVKSYNETSNKIKITPAQATYLSAKTMNRYLAFAKRAAGPKLWGLVEEGDVKPADFYAKNWTKEKMTENGGFYNSYFNLDDRMKAAYVYSTYNFGPSSFGNKVRNNLEKGNYHTAIHSINSTWKDKNGVVHTNYRWMNNMAFAMSSEQTMMTFINKESDKYISTEIKQALNSESPKVNMLLKLQEKYSQNVIVISNYDIQEMKGKELSKNEKERYDKLKIQSKGLLENINKIKVEIGEPPIVGYDKEKNLTNFDQIKEYQVLSEKLIEEKNKYNEEKLKELDVNLDEVASKLINNPTEEETKKLKSALSNDKLKALYLTSKGKEFEPKSEELKNNPNLDKIKEIAVQKQNEEIEKRKRVLKNKI